MSVHYKFKSALDFDTITFDGLHINVADLKKAIIHQKRLGKNVDFDLQITNAQTKEEYNEDTALIPKNTSLIIARIPLAPNAAKRFQNIAQSKNSVAVPTNKGESDSKHVDLAAMDGSETDKINAMMHQSTADYDPTNYQKVRGGGQIGEVPLGYRCHRCHKPGHWIKNCPLGPVQRDMPEVKRSTGIPRSFIERDKNATVEQPPTIVPEMPKTEVPEDLICSICKDLFTDAVMIPCCGSSFCDECVRTALLESEDNECPDCQEKGTSPASLIPNRFLRRSVNNFKNETGYIVPKKQKVERTQETEDAEIQENDIEPNELTELEQVESREDYLENNEPNISHQNDSDTGKQEHRKIDEDLYPMNMHAVSSNAQESQHYHDSEDYNIRTAEIYQRSDKGHEQSNEHRSGPIPAYNMQSMHAYSNSPYPHSGGAPQHMNQNFMMRPFNQPMQGYGRPSYIQQRGYGQGGYPPRNRHIAPYPDVNTIYQGVAQQVGTGIIDDPLEAFNRIMREKERAKEEQARRRSPGYINKYRRSRTPDRRRKRRSNSFEASPKRFDRRPNDRKRRRSRSFSSSRSRTRSPIRKRSFTPRKYSKSPLRRSRSISQHNRQQHRSQRRGDYRESSDRGGGARKDNDTKKSPVGSSRSKYKDSRHRSKKRDAKKKSRSRSLSRMAGQNNKPVTGEKEKDRLRRRSIERSPYHDASIKHIPSLKSNYANNVNNAFPLEFNDVLPPGVEEFDDESWQTNEKYVVNKAPNSEKAERSNIQTTAKHSSSEISCNKQENENDDSKNAKDKKVNKDKKRRKKETEKEKEVHGKKSKKHKREKSDRDGSQETSKVDSLEKPESKINETSDSDVKPIHVTDTIKTNENDKTLTPPLSAITKSDSVLDLYDNIDLDIFGDQSLNQSDDFLALPEPSKWEMDEKPSETSESRRLSISREQTSSKNTKTEKPYGKDSSPILSAIVRPTSESTTSSSVHNLKISVPAKSTNHSERSIELKSTSKHDKMKSVVSNDGKESKKPSIKDRLGEKIKEKSSDRRPADPGRSNSSKLASAALRNDNHKNERERDRDKSKSTRSHYRSGSHHNSDKTEIRSSRPRSLSAHKKIAVPSSKLSKSRASSSSSTSSSDSNEGETRTKKSNKKEKKSKKKRSGSKSSDNDSNTSLDKKKKSSKKKSKKEKKKKREKEKNKS